MKAPRSCRRFITGLIVLAVLMPLAAHAASSPATYKVRSGDNLSVIGARFGVTVNELKKANGLKSDVLSIGQKLRIEKPFRKTGHKDVRWVRPSNRLGRVLRPYGQYNVDGILMPRTGVDLACPEGTNLVSPANGVVRYLGSMDGFGLLVIIEHGGGYATVMSPFDPDGMKVVTGQAVLRGDPVGRTGRPIDYEDDPHLHLELRRNDKAIKPDRLYK